MKTVMFSLLMTTLVMTACDILNQSSPSPSEPTTPTSGGVGRVVVSPAATTVNAGNTVRLSASVEDENGNPISGKIVDWFTYDAAVATVDNTGTVRGVSQGTATITASVEGKRGSSRVVVGQNPAPGGMTITAVGPQPLVEGGQGIIQGSGFGNVPSNLWVYVDGVVGKVSATNGTALQFTVPVTGKPAHNAEVKVRLLTAYSNTVLVPIKP